MKKVCKKLLTAFLAALVLSGFSGCNDYDDNSSDIETSESESREDRHIETTKTGRYAIDADGADEGLSGFTTTEETTSVSLENPLPDEPDPDIVATTTRTWYTTTTTKATTTKKASTKKSSTKNTKETEFAADKLHKPTDSEKFKSKKKYKVTSDTTYLNLRFGPSKKYEIRLRIPDGAVIYGTAKTKTGNDGWIYVTYKGTAGWVMEELLKSES